MLQKVASKDLKVGMFVAELDRPWMDTPFLLQGFLLEDENQVSQMRTHTDWVMIDIARSVGEEYDRRPAKKVPIPPRDLGTAPILTVQRTQAPRPTSPEATPTPKKPDASNGVSGGKKAPSSEEAPRARSRDFAITTKAARSAEEEAVSAPVPPASRTTPSAKAPSSSFGSLFGQLKSDLKSLFGKREKETYDDSHGDVALTDAEPVRAAFIPESVQLVIYEDRATVEDELGKAQEAFQKSQEVLNRMVDDIRSGRGLQLADLDDVIEDMVDSMVRNPDAMMWVAKLRESDSRSYDQGLGVAISLVAFGRHLGFPKDQLAHLGVLGLMLDIGKIRVRREILEKTDHLSPEEFIEVKNHVRHSIDILHATANIHQDVVDGVAQHHERMNGSGYPMGLAGSKISVFGRMAAIADTFSAVTKKRAYAEAVSAHEALQMLSNWSGTQFQADMVEQFIQSIGVFPVGSLVELSTGEVAVVATHNKLKRLKPKVLVVTETDKTLRKYPVTRDLIYDVSDRPTYIRRGLPSNAYGIDPSEYYLT